MRFIIVNVLFIFLAPNLIAQTSIYPKGYFRNPLNVPLDLSANFGELRSNHWHMGLDIRTKQRENLPVHAAAQGYISRVGVGPQGFGRFIVINHPNGLSTLYGHMNDFFPELEEYVTRMQYEKESWAVELFLTKDQFPVSKGKYIGNSGNTGGSQGPHLHFEIRDTKTDRCLNPLLFGFELKDNVPPSIIRLAVYDRSISVFDQSPALYNLKKTESGYIIPKIPELSTGLRKLSFGIQAYDRFTGSPNPNGIYSAKLFLDDIPQVSFSIDSIDYDATAYLNAHIDYRHRYKGGVYIQHLNELPGSRSGLYKNLSGNGIIDLTDTNAHAIRIEVSDAYGNQSELLFNLRFSDMLAEKMNPEGSGREYFYASQVNLIEKPDFEVYLPETALYDSVPVNYSRTDNSLASAISAQHIFNEPYIPVHGNFTVRIKPTGTIETGQEDKLVIQLLSGKRKIVKKAELQSGWLVAKFSDFGIFQAFIDNNAPDINAPGKIVKDTMDLSPAKRIVFTPSDNFGINNFRAEMDGSWLRFTNDKSRSFIYIFDERVSYGIHELKVAVEDLVGNTTTKTWVIKKYPYTPPKKKVTKKRKAPVKKKAPVTKKKN